MPFYFPTTTHVNADSHVWTKGRQAILVNELLPTDLTETLEEGQREKCMGVPNLHITRHLLDQTHEVLQL